MTARSTGVGEPRGQAPVFPLRLGPLIFGRCSLGLASSSVKQANPPACRGDRGQRPPCTSCVRQALADVYPVGCWCRACPAGRSLPHRGWDGAIPQAGTGTNDC